MKKLIVFILLCFWVVTPIIAQKSYEVVKCPTSRVDNTTAEIKDVMTFGDSVILVLCEMVAEEDIDKLIPRISLLSKLVISKSPLEPSLGGNYKSRDSLELRNIVALKPGTMEPTDEESGFLGLNYWKDIKKGEKYPFLAIYEGSLPKGVELFTITSSNEDFFSFKDVKIDNPLIDKQTYYIARPTTKLNLRNAPSQQAQVIGSVVAGEIVFLDTRDEKNGFYKVYVLNSSKEGYLNKKYIKLGEAIQKPSKGMFQMLSSRNANEPPTAEVFNNTAHVLTLTLGGKKYVFQPHSKRTITVKPGTQYYMATSPGVRSSVGTQTFEMGGEYSWEFVIVTKYQ